ncbi:hypothetical protein [Pedobacter puniceum]|jgi:hypothetical protein|uniref:Beta-lactamase-inhibitor-like PepSY-like domain-containing protein n=1 Tax=Pedobacter puniceum TaxID=2666136 RepID=A0A7K0FJ88_9SPHI|nr:MULTISPECIES: hypothetical protein [Pedobacter]KHJ37993.1 hypothetical protein PBAC_18580 [Pedobacter glucosidilyticus]MRX46046.1 hypothetical protein [Pedobacter puniceum]
MRKFILTAAVVAFAGLASAEAKSLSFEKVVFAQDTTKQDTTKQDTTKQDTTKKTTPAPQESLTGNAEVAQDTTKQTPTQQTPATEQSNPVNMEDLPEAVKTTLKADIFKEWVPSSATLVKSEDKEYYQIEVKKGEEVRAIRIGADGKVVQ